jgi:alpha,alpha-trehalase
MRSCPTATPVRWSRRTARSTGCVPAVDSPSIFGSLLDREGGSFRFGPYGIVHPVSRAYVPGTNVLETTWRTRTGWVVVRDALTMGPYREAACVTEHTRPPADADAEHMLVRTVECVSGTVELELTCEPAFDYGRSPATWSVIDGEKHTADASGAGQTVRLRTDLLVGVEGNRLRARHVLSDGDRAFCALSWADQLVVPPNVDGAFHQMAGTVAFWRDWIANSRMPDHRWREALQRSALAIKGLTYMPTGATVAALTTSLPETPGGARNWDYRYTWMRDSTFTLRALHYLLLDWEADEFMQFVADLEPTEDGSLQIMYGVDGRRDLTESSRDDLSGYEGAAPVRVGNGAFNQKQNDVFGAVLDSILLHTRHSNRLPRRLWPIVESQADGATRVWQHPDQGIWEARGKPRHYVSSKLMCWVALDRAAKLAEIRGDPQKAAGWHQTADEIKADILARGVSDKGVLREHYDTDALDASTLLAAILGFLPPEDERLRNTVNAIADDLTEHGFVLRYRTDETDDGMSGKEGSFIICSFWLVSAFAMIGEIDRARDMMDRLLRVASPLGLYAEEFETETARHLGNFPQAFSHLALIEAAGRIILAEMLEGM